MNIITVYAIFFDMESDLPDAYVLSEEVAKDLTQGESADYVTLDVEPSEWMALLTGR